MAIIETVATGLSIVNTAKTLYDWVMGNTVTKQLDQITAQIEKLDKHIYYIAQQEVWNTSISKQETINDLKQIKQVAYPIQRAIGRDIIVSKPILSPHRLKTMFEKNAEEILFDIQPLRGNGIPEGYLRDNTMLPVTFTQWGQEFIGLIKIGYARDYLDIQYKPQTQVIVPPQTTKSILTSSNKKLLYKSKPSIAVHNQKLWENIVRIIAEQLGIDERTIIPEASFIDDLGADSLDTVALIMAFEEEYGIKIPDKAAERLTTAEDVYKYAISRYNL